MTSTMKTRIDVAIASTGRRRIVIQRARVAWKVISRITDAKLIPPQYGNATRYEKNASFEPVARATIAVMRTNTTPTPPPASIHPLPPRNGSPFSDPAGGAGGAGELTSSPRAVGRVRAPARATATAAPAAPPAAGGPQAATRRPACSGRAAA